MRYIVLGCGAIGGTVAAGLVRDGHDVLVCDADAAVVQAINDAGLRIEGPVEQFTVKVPAVLPADLPGQIDGPVLVAVKAHHTGAAAALLAGRLTGDGFAVSLQNGLTAAMLADVLGSGRVVGAAVNFGADAIEPGVILRGNRATLLVGELDGRPSERVARLAADLADARATADVLGYIWTKEAYGATLFATAVSDLPIHAVFADPAYRPLLTAVAAEVLAQAPVRPLPLDGFDPADVPGSLDRMVEFNRQSAKSHSGVYRDLAIRHRPTEAGAILGPLQGVLLRRISELVGAIERGERACTRENLDLLAACERAERLGRPVNAVVAVTGAPARAAAGPLAGQPVAVKDIVAVAGLPRRCGSPATTDDPSPADATAGNEAARGRCRGLRDDAVPGVRGRVRAPGHRRHPEPAGPGPYVRRLVRGIGRGHRRGRLRARDRHRHRRLDPHPGRVLRRRRAQAELPAGAGGRRVPAGAQLRPRRPAGSQRG